MAQEAIQRGYDKQPETISQFELARQTVLVNAFLQDHIKNHPVTEDAIKKEYEALKKEAGSKEYGLRHILAKDESEAKSIAAQIKKGAKFEDLAKKYSLDPGSKDKGGSLGWVMPTNFIPTFADAFVNLKKGGVSSPIKVEDGWHLIKVDDVRDFKFPSYRDLKGKITLSLQQQGIQKTIVDMRAKAKIE
jgi:peptidyl-prolyl cis-trans isomerase C